MKKTNKLKNFDDILEFLSYDPEHIISQLKRKKKFINEWIEAFLEEKPIIEPSVRWDASSNYFPIWANNFLKLTKEICQNCVFFNKECTNNEELNKCLDKYYSFIDLHTGRIDKVNEQTVNTFKNKMQQVLNGSEVYVSDTKYEYTTEIDSGKFDNREIRDMKKSIYGFPLLKTEIDRHASYYQDEFNDVIRITENHTHNYNCNKIQRSVFIFISLYYLFFWDFLNNKKLRDCPNAYEVKLLTDERDMWIAEGDIIFRPKTKTPEEMEERANQTELPNYDPSYKKNHNYLFKHEIVPIEKVFEFADMLNKLIGYQKLSSIVEADLPNDVNNLFKRLIKNKKMLKTPLRSDGRGNANYTKCEEHNLKKYFTYQSYKLLITFLLSVSETKLRNKKPNIPRKNIELLLKKIEQYPSSNLTELIEKYKIGKYSTVMDIINNNINDHPNYDKYERYDPYGKAKRIIEEASKDQNKKWLDKIYSD